MKEITALEDVQALQLSIVDKVDEFCRIAGIRYFLAYGTLIGAVRHQGFIPWDDDIDLWMLRGDYDRFETEFPAWAKDHGLYLNSPSTTPGYNRVFNKVCDNRTLGVEESYRNDFEEGCWVDVFPVDAVPEGSLARWLKIMNIPVSIVTALSTVMLPRATKVLAEGDEGGYEHYLLASFAFVAVIVGFICLGISSVATLCPYLLRGGV